MLCCTLGVNIFPNFFPRCVGVLALGFLPCVVTVTTGDRISQADSPRNRKEAEMSSTLAALPVAAKVPELQQARAGAAKEDIFSRRKAGGQKAMYAARNLEMVKSHHSSSSTIPFH